MPRNVSNGVTKQNDTAIIVFNYMIAALLFRNFQLWQLKRSSVSGLISPALSYTFICTNGEKNKRKVGIAFESLVAIRCN